MRKTSAALASLSLAVLALTGCTAAPTFDGATCDRAASTSGIDDAVTVTGDVGVAPDVELFAPLHVETTSYTDVVTGEGTALTSPQQLAVLDIALFDGTTGDQIVQTEFDGDLSRLSNIASWSQQIPGIGEVLECATPGTRMVAAIAPEDFGAEALSGFQLDDDTTVVAVIDVLDTYLAQATGSKQFNNARNLPTVVRAPDGRPGIIVPDDAAPTEQVEQVLIKGDGETVEADTIPWVNYTAVGWDTKTVSGTSWDANPVSNLAEIEPTVAEALVGQPIGSQLLVVVPAAEDGEATAYVVDILGASPATGQ
ncbi:FKBP-type peptidyl-prolyl cis-trans isomerase [Microbacterium sp. GXF0217]